MLGRLKLIKLAAKALHLNSASKMFTDGTSLRLQTLEFVC